LLPRLEIHQSWVEDAYIPEPEITLCRSVSPASKFNLNSPYVTISDGQLGKLYLSNLANGKGKPCTRRPG